LQHTFPKPALASEDRNLSALGIWPPMRKSHHARRDLIDTYAAVEHSLDSEAQIAQSGCAAVDRVSPPR